MGGRLGIGVEAVVIEDGSFFESALTHLIDFNDFAIINVIGAFLFMFSTAIVGFEHVFRCFFGCMTMTII